MPGCTDSVDPHLDTTWIKTTRGCSVDQQAGTLEWIEATGAELMTSRGSSDLKSKPVNGHKKEPDK